MQMRVLIHPLLIHILIKMSQSCYLQFADFLLEIQILCIYVGAHTKNVCI
jgi:hypothetical protein